MLENSIKHLRVSHASRLKSNRKGGEHSSTISCSPLLNGHKWSNASRQIHACRVAEMILMKTGALTSETEKKYSSFLSHKEPLSASDSKKETKAVRPGLKEKLEVFRKTR